MNTITVKASSEYRVLIGSGLMRNLSSYVKELIQGEKIVVISDSNVWPLYGNDVLESLRNAGFEVYNYVFSAGESSKNGETFLEILNFLAKKQLARNDLLIALGGGVVGDITGFAAAVYLRGISYVQIPTTLLAMVDSSVGGKTAIDLPAGKNLAGAFYQPCLVLCDTNTLHTLPDNVFRDGCAEVIKYGILYDEDLFAHLWEKGMDFDRESVISRCVSLKRDVVSDDEFDRGERQKLNLGHTVGHAIEKCSNFSVSHGAAVATGIAVISKACAKLNLCDDQTYDRILQVLCLFGLHTGTDYDANALSQYALSDKKRSGSTVNLIVPHAIGRCAIHPIPVEELKSFIQAGL